MRKNSLLSYSVCLLLVLTGISCGTQKQILNTLEKGEDPDSFFLGLSVFNPETGKKYISINSEKLFTPASNTKLYTFYAAHKTLGDSVPVFSYLEQGDSLILRGTANPDLLYKTDSTLFINFFKENQKKTFLADAKIDEPVLGKGWAWDDYQDYYQVEKCLFPLYGNIVTYSVDSDTLTVTPLYFKNRITRVDSLSKTRDLSSNQFYAQDNKKAKYVVPFKTSNEITAALLQDILDREITLIPDVKKEFKKVYSESYDSIYRRMLVVSDNFIAEQLMLQVGYATTGKYSVEAGIDYVLEHFLNELPQMPKWIDGSGLSRYNLFSPDDTVHLLHKMYTEIPLDKLLSYFAVGGKTGTIKAWYENERPFIYAKSGSLANNHNLSGYLITKKGTVLIFSFMNNHYTLSNTRIKKNMEKLFEFLYSRY